MTQFTSLRKLPQMSGPPAKFVELVEAAAALKAWSQAWDPSSCSSRIVLGGVGEVLAKPHSATVAQPNLVIDDAEFSRHVRSVVVDS